ncbi:hypothetical protein SVEN_5894 [Streptomyces venezuelae ATCC 10712]|uniref:Uncharacterized protein n=1 Tax=Streptomyces venezuelae (strain ATCC 10712 / CBS 650.69 / DSM 40230 / JCM 4526 / NBRC 13096 / PD 04745) TaxID=953739 RepID=F2RAW1_STRVP|nr:hypothetical protein SVEN_5894 [Streptomyces venezuelae ATCC 10712]
MVTSRIALLALLEPPGREPPEVPPEVLSLSLLWLLLEPPELLLPPPQLPPCEPRAPVRATTAMPKTAIART